MRVSGHDDLYCNQNTTGLLALTLTPTFHFSQWKDGNYYFSQGLTRLEMMNCFTALLADESGFIISAELVLVGTLLVIGLVVGMVEIQNSLNAELNDVADAIGSLNQSYTFSGMSSQKKNGGFKGKIAGSSFNDTRDECDNNQCDLSCDAPVAESYKGW